MAEPMLIFETSLARQAAARIWEYEDGRILFQCLKPTGKDTTVFCNSLEEAQSLWKQMASRMQASETGV